MRPTPVSGGAPTRIHLLAERARPVEARLAAVQPPLLQLQDGLVGEGGVTPAGLPIADQSSALEDGSLDASQSDTIVKEAQNDGPGGKENEGDKANDDETTEKGDSKSKSDQDFFGDGSANIENLMTRFDVSKLNLEALKKDDETEKVLGPNDFIIPEKLLPGDPGAEEKNSENEKKKLNDKGKKL